MDWRSSAFMALILGFVMVSAPSAAQEPMLADKAIGDKIQQKMKKDPGVEALKVNISVTNRVVILTGELDNVLAKERAVSVAETANGARAVVDMLRVFPPPLMADGEIREQVAHAIADSAVRGSSNVSATVSENIVTLTGTVKSWQRKRLAEIAAKGVRGVAGVNNLLTVQYDVERTDAEVKSDIEQTLKWDTLVNHGTIVVDVQNGVVILHGRVGSRAEKRRAVTDAYVTGVTSVDSTGLAVEDETRNQSPTETGYVQKSDADILKALTDALLIDPRVRYFNVYPEVSYGTVILHGEVSGFEARNAAESDARHTVGVKNVENRLTVIPSIYVSDSEIEDQARNALLRDPFLERHEIKVHVFNGIVKLSGRVDSRFEKRRAEETASKVRGVAGIANHLLLSSRYEPRSAPAPNMSQR